MRTLIDNFGWKALSLAIAFTLWASYVEEAELATSIAAPLQYRNLPHDLEISGDVPERVYLNVRGPASRLGAPEVAQASVILDLSGVGKAGEQTFALNAHNVYLPGGVSLVRVVPAHVHLTFERRATREVPVSPRFTGGPPSGYRIARTQVFPDRVKIGGPESRVRSIEAAQTDAVDLSTTVGEAEFRVPIFVSDPYVRVELDGPVTVKVTVEKVP